MPEGERRLAAIMFTDIVGYTAMAQADEPKALETLQSHRELARPIFTKHNGKEIKTMGDAFLVEFSSALAATQCAIELEGAIEALNTQRHDKIALRIGIHVGDVIHEGGDLLGDAVNVASRIEPLAEGGGVCLSQQAYDQVRNKVPFTFARLESQNLKNVSVPIEVYRLETRAEAGQVELQGLHPSRRIAVLPFANMSPDPGDEYFADGMTEEMISTLSKISEIEVISRTSVIQYKRTPKTARQVFKELNAGTLLEGSVRKDGKRLRVTVQMIDAQNDRHLWSESYDRNLENIFQIQTDIARQTAEVLKVKMLPETSMRLGTGRAGSSEAYAMYLNARYHWNRRTLDDVRKAEGYFQMALAEDPSFALGYVGLADCYNVLTTNFRLNVEENHEKARSMVSKALELDPNLAEAHATWGVLLFFDFSMKAAEEEFRKAIELNPSYVSVRQWYSQLLMAELRWDEALFQIRKASELDPLSHIIRLVQTVILDAKRDYPAALELARETVELSPNDPSSRFELAWLSGKAKKFEDAEEQAELGAGLARPSFPYAQLGAKAMVGVLRGEKEEIRKLLPELKAHLGETFTSVHFIADLHFFLGENNEGFSWLERALAERELDVIYLKSNEFLDEVRSDARYLTLLERLGIDGTGRPETK